MLCRYNYQYAENALGDLPNATQELLPGHAVVVQLLRCHYGILLHKLNQPLQAKIYRVVDLKQVQQSVSLLSQVCRFGKIWESLGIQCAFRCHWNLHQIVTCSTCQSQEGFCAMYDANLISIRMQLHHSKPEVACSQDQSKHWHQQCQPLPWTVESYVANFRLQNFGTSQVCG